MALFDSTRTLGVPGGSFHGDASMSASMYGRGGSTCGVDRNALDEISSDISSANIATCTGRIAQYQLQTVIGNGKFSTVWKGLYMPTGTVTAVKKVQIYEIMDNKQRADCVNEVRLLQSFNHPNIIKYTDSFIENNELVITLEFCDCGDLGGLIKDRLAAGAFLAEGHIWSIFTQLCTAVSHMHKNRVMHRDIKPGNVFLSASGVVKLGDLGLSRYLSSQTAQAKSMVGTPYYMSPECIRGQPYEWSSDIWSLGCLLYELAALRNPFNKPGLNYYTLGKLITACEYDPLPDHCSQELKQLVAAMIQRDATKRPGLAEICVYADQCRAKFRDVC